MPCGFTSSYKWSKVKWSEYKVYFPIPHPVCVKQFHIKKKILPKTSTVTTIDCFIILLSVVTKRMTSLLSLDPIKVSSSCSLKEFFLANLLYDLLIRVLNINLILDFFVTTSVVRRAIKIKWELNWINFVYKVLWRSLL